MAASHPTSICRRLHLRRLRLISRPHDSSSTASQRTRITVATWLRGGFARQPHDAPDEITCPSSSRSARFRRPRRVQPGMTFCKPSQFTRRIGRGMLGFLDESATYSDHGQTRNHHERRLLHGFPPESMGLNRRSHSHPTADPCRKRGNGRRFALLVTRAGRSGRKGAQKTPGVLRHALKTEVVGL